MSRKEMDLQVPKKGKDWGHFHIHIGSTFPQQRRELPGEKKLPRELSSPSRGRTGTSCTRSRVLTSEPPGKPQGSSIFSLEANSTEPAVLRQTFSESLQLSPTPHLLIPVDVAKFKPAASLGSWQSVWPPPPLQPSSEFLLCYNLFFSLFKKKSFLQRFRDNITNNIRFK